MVASSWRISLTTPRRNGVSTPKLHPMTWRSTISHIGWELEQHKLAIEHITCISEIIQTLSFQPWRNLPFLLASEYSLILQYLSASVVGPLYIRQCISTFETPIHPAQVRTEVFAIVPPVDRQITLEARRIADSIRQTHCSLALHSFHFVRAAQASCISPHHNSISTSSSNHTAYQLDKI